jgi:hypothetical protein
MPSRDRDVFINCPFDGEYQEFFRAIVFVVLRSGFRPRCALETDDSSQNRFEKICQIIGECRYGIHDISRTELDLRSKLPRFNMPLELGIFFGAKRFGGKAQKKKRCVVMDRDKFRYRKFISDISGQDIHSHRGRLNVLLAELTSWLRTDSHDQMVPGGKRMAVEFSVFTKELPYICAERHLDPNELTFGDYIQIIEQYLKETA